MLRPTGATFGPNFDPDDVDYADFGSLAFQLPSCEAGSPKGTLYIYPDGLSNYESLVIQNYEQLTRLVDCETGVGAVNNPLSGSWYDPTHNGEGIILQVLENGTAVVQWFTYDEAGDQMWIQGTGTFDGNTLTVENLFTSTGTAWGTGFDTEDIDYPAWGVLEIIFGNCGEAVLNYDSGVGFGAGTLNLVRLSTLMGMPCIE
jgi:hypothetical protein